MLLGGAAWLHRATPARGDWVAIGGLGVCLFLNQLLYVLGLNLAGVTLATCLQPSIPVFTVLLCMAVRQEHVSVSRCLGAPPAASLTEEIFVEQETSVEA